MKLIKRDVRGVVVVEVHGKLIGGPENSEMFHDLFRSLVEDGKNKVAVNLRHTRWANSQGIGMLIGAYTSLRKVDGDLVLAHVIDRIKDILTVTRLLLIFKTFETEDEAVEYLVESSEERRDNSTEKKLSPKEASLPRAVNQRPA